jgi:hypothetical protein
MGGVMGRTQERGTRRSAIKRQEKAYAEFTEVTEFAEKRKAR